MRIQSTTCLWDGSNEENSCTAWGFFESVLNYWIVLTCLEKKEEYIWQFYIKLTDVKKTGCRAVYKNAGKKYKELFKGWK